MIEGKGPFSFAWPLSIYIYIFLFRFSIIITPLLVIFSTFLVALPGGVFYGRGVGILCGRALIAVIGKRFGHARALPEQKCGNHTLAKGFRQFPGCIFPLISCWNLPIFWAARPFPVSCEYAGSTPLGCLNNRVHFSARAPCPGTSTYSKRDLIMSVMLCLVLFFLSKRKCHHFVHQCREVSWYQNVFQIMGMELFASISLTSVQICWY